MASAIKNTQDLAQAACVVFHSSNSRKICEAGANQDSQPGCLLAPESRMKKKVHVAADFAASKRNLETVILEAMEHPRIRVAPWGIWSATSFWGAVSCAPLYMQPRLCARKAETILAFCALLVFSLRHWPQWRPRKSRKELIRSCPCRFHDPTRLPPWLWAYNYFHWVVPLPCTNQRAKQGWIDWCEYQLTNIASVWCLPRCFDPLQISWTLICSICGGVLSAILLQDGKPRYFELRLRLKDCLMFHSRFDASSVSVHHEILISSVLKEAWNVEAESRGQNRIEWEWEWSAQTRPMKLVFLCTSLHHDIQEEFSCWRFIFLAIRVFLGFACIMLLNVAEHAAQHSLWIEKHTEADSSRLVPFMWFYQIVIDT